MMPTVDDGSDGPDGPDGPDGLDGDNRETGSAGASGVSDTADTNGTHRLPGDSGLEVFASVEDLREAAFRDGSEGLPVAFITATQQALGTPPVEVLDI